MVQLMPVFMLVFVCIIAVFVIVRFKRRALQTPYTLFKVAFAKRRIPNLPQGRLLCSFPSRKLGPLVAAALWGAGLTATFLFPDLNTMRELWLFRFVCAGGVVANLYWLSGRIDWFENAAVKRHLFGKKTVWYQETDFLQLAEGEGPFNRRGGLGYALMRGGEKRLEMSASKFQNPKRIETCFTVENPNVVLIQRDGQELRPTATW